MDFGSRQEHANRTGPIPKPERMNKPEHEDATRMQGLDAGAHRSFVLFGESRKPIPGAVLDERITVCKADPSWPEWSRQETARLRSVLSGDLVPEIQHIGSTAVPGLDAKPIVDLMVGLFEPGQIAEVAERLERLGYESLGEAGVPGRWALRRRDVAQPSNIAIVAYQGEWWKLNLAVRGVRTPRAPGTTPWRNGMPSAVARICCSLTPMPSGS